jgi:hemerythrin-like domain-containing protein
MARRESVNLIDRLEAEHRQAAAALAQLDRALQPATPGPARDAARSEAESALRVVCEIVHGHAEAEEELVFPLMHGTGMDPLLGTLVEEHRTVRALYETTCARLSTWAAGAGPDDGDWMAVARDLRGRLAMHMQRENLLVFPRARRLAPDVRAVLENR